ncbi:MAG: class I SAM-dependent methyltransferase [Deltaproteobacteria bacterium]|nr:class I SAM-dependent methyltransferase [Deltaproteobacteria bacterium]
MLLTEIDRLYSETISPDTHNYDGSQDKNEFKQCVEILSARIGGMEKNDIWFLEIGAYKGLWALALKVICAHHGKRPNYVTVTWISHDPNNLDIFNTEKVYTEDNLIYYLIDADSTLEKTWSQVIAIRQLFDFVFIDGDHAFKSVMQDIKNYGTLAKEYLLFHDINTPDCGVKKAINQSGIFLNMSISYNHNLMGIGIKDCRTPTAFKKRRKFLGIF